MKAIFKYFAILNIPLTLCLPACIKEESKGRVINSPCDYNTVNTDFLKNCVEEKDTTFIFTPEDLYLGYTTEYNKAILFEADRIYNSCPRFNSKIELVFFTTPQFESSLFEIEGFAYYTYDTSPDNGRGLGREFYQFSDLPDSTAMRPNNTGLELYHFLEMECKDKLVARERDNFDTGEDVINFSMTIDSQGGGEKENQDYIKQYIDSIAINVHYAIADTTS